MGAMSFRPMVFSSNDFEKYQELLVILYIIMEIVLLFSMHYFGMQDTMYFFL